MYTHLYLLYHCHIQEFCIAYYEFKLSFSFSPTLFLSLFFFFPSNSHLQLFSRNRNVNTMENRGRTITKSYVCKNKDKKNPKSSLNSIMNICFKVL